MAHTDVDSNRGNSYLTTILVAVVLLALLYFMAKGCTNRDVKTTPAHHGAIINTAPAITS